VSAIHYSGAICYAAVRSTTHIIGGWAACCSGDRARKIKREGNATRDAKKVTCKTCKKLLKKRVHCRVHPEA